MAADLLGRLLRALTEDGIAATRVRGDRIEVSAIPDARRPLDPWVIIADDAALNAAVSDRLRERDGPGKKRNAKAAIQAVAWTIINDLRVYDDPAWGPFTLGAGGALVPQNPVSIEDDPW